MLTATELWNGLGDIKEIATSLTALEKIELMSRLKLALVAIYELNGNEDVTPQEFGFNDLHMKLFRFLTAAAGESVTKQQICDYVWDNPEVRYTEHKFHNTLYKVKQVLRTRGIHIISWGKETWRIETASVPLAEKLLSRVDYNIKTSEVRAYSNINKNLLTNLPMSTQLEPDTIVVPEAVDSKNEDPDQPPSTGW